MKSISSTLVGGLGQLMQSGLTRGCSDQPEQSSLHNMNSVTPQPPPLSLYVHLPWCESKCPYCDFNSHPLRQNLREDDYLDALLVDLQQEKNVFKIVLSIQFSSVAARPVSFLHLLLIACSPRFARALNVPSRLRSPSKQTLVLLRSTGSLATLKRA